MIAWIRNNPGKSIAYAVIAVVLGVFVGGLVYFDVLHPDRNRPFAHPGADITAGWPSNA